MNVQQDAYIGTSGWKYPRSSGDLYETGLRQRDELAYLSLPMNSADIAGSFCSLQKPERSARWRDETHPPGAGRHCRPAVPSAPPLPVPPAASPALRLDHITTPACAYFDKDANGAAP